MKLSSAVKKNCALVIAASLVLSVSFAGCSKKPAVQAGRQQDPKSVKVAAAAVTPIVVNVEYSCKLKPVQEINISPEVSGKVATINADVGASVVKDQVLFTLDATDLQTQLRQQQANRDYYQASLARTKESSLEQQVLTAEQALNKAQVAYEDAKTTYEKNTILYQMGSISKQALDDSESKLRTATIDFNTNRDNLSVLKQKTGPQSIDVANAQLQQAVAGVDSIASKLDSSAVKSPINGVLSVRNINQGELVTTATKAVTVIDTTALIAEVLLPDSIVQKIQKGQKIPVKVNGLDKPLDGMVDTMSPSIDNSTQSYTVRIKLDNGNNSLKPGMLARAVLPAEKKENVITVPNEAVKIESGVNYVYVVQNNNKVKKQPVTIGLSNEKVTEITSNVKENDQVILEGQTFLNDGETVKPVK